MRTKALVCSWFWFCSWSVVGVIYYFLSSVSALFQGRGAAVPAPQTKTKAPREEDFENIKLISNGAYGYGALVHVLLSPPPVGSHASPRCSSSL